MKCKLCSVSVINGIGYQGEDGIICEKCRTKLNPIIIKDGKYLTDYEFLHKFVYAKTIYHIEK